MEAGICEALEEAEAAANAIAALVSKAASSAKEGRRVDWASLQSSLMLISTALDSMTLAAMETRAGVAEGLEIVGEREGTAGSSFGSGSMRALQVSARQVSVLSEALASMAEADDVSAQGAARACAALDARAAGAELTTKELTKELARARAREQAMGLALSRSEATRRSNAGDRSRREQEEASRRHRLAVAYLKAADDAEATKKAATAAQADLQTRLDAAIKAGVRERISTFREQGKRMRAQADLEDSRLELAASQLVQVGIMRLVDILGRLEQQKKDKHEEMADGPSDST